MKRGTIVVHLSAANKVPPMLAPKVAIKAAAVNAAHLSVYPDAVQVCTHPTQERLCKLFEKPDLAGA